MSDAPDVDGRRREAIREHVAAIAPYYTESWNPESPGPGTTLLELFAGLAADVTERLDRVPEKHQVAFLDTLGFDRRPPQPARAPVSLQVADGAGQNVVVDGGTRAIAGGTDTRPEQSFEITADGRFEATPANLAAVYSVAPAVDGIYDHWAPSDGTGLSEGGTPALLTGQNQQTHALYVGDVDQLNVGGDSESDAGTTTVRVKVETDTPWSKLRNDLVWEYYGERSVDGESVEGWHAFTRQPAGWEAFTGQLAWVSRALLSQLPPALGFDDSGADEVVLDLGLDGTLTETTVNGVESRWIRASVPPYADVEDFTDVRVGRSVRVGPGPSAGQGTGGGSDDDGDDGDGGNGRRSLRSVSPDRLLYNDVPLPFGDGEPTTVYPLGTAPIQRDSFYVASSEAFTKSGARIRLTFDGLAFSSSSTGDRPGEWDVDDATAIVLGNDTPRLSWEYWDGTGWSRIERLDDRTNGLTASKTETADGTVGNTVSFPVPDDLAKTTVAGHENHWIRCRLVGGSYGKRVGREDSDGNWQTKHLVHPPQFETLSIDYVPPTSTATGATGESGGEGSGAESGPAAALPLEPATHLFAENHLAYSGNLAETDGEWVRPFEPLPDEEQTLYLGFDGRLHGGPITLFFDVEDRTYPTAFHPRVRWEYCADPTTDEWVRLDVQDGTEGLTERGIVRLVFPGETTGCRRFGTERHWIRARVTRDAFDPLTFQVPFDPGTIDPGELDFGGFDPGLFDPSQFGSGWLPPGGFDVPSLTGSTLDWAQPLAEMEWPAQWEVPVETGGAMEATGTAARTGTAAAADAFESTDVAAVTSPTDVSDAAASTDADESTPTSDSPSSVTATATDAAADAAADAAGAAVDAVADATADSTVTTGSTQPAWQSTATSRLNATSVAETVATAASQSWTVQPFQPVEVGEYVSVPQFPTNPQVPTIPDWIGPWLPFLPSEPPDERGGPPEPCGRTLQTDPPAGDPTTRPPTVRGIDPNTAWAYNVRTVEDETLGSSDGSQSQSFVAGTPPVIEETVWVDELAALSEGARRELREAETPAVETERGGDGSVRAFWVAWQAVSDFLDSEADDRHYTVDRTAGRITFGDGTRGRIPPRGRDNVRIDYRTGGGPDGNVDVGAVGELASSIQYVERVTNPAPGTGGAAAESTDETVSRAPKQLRDRDRAVTDADYERVAMDAARRLARVKCLSGLNRAGESASGWVTLLLVPNAPRTKPVPSTGLKEQVRSAVGDRAPATLVAADRLVVRGPSYVEVSVTVDLVAAGPGSVATLEESVGGGLAAFLHPLTGGEDGAGWAFGELPAMSDLYALVEGVDGVDHVTELSVRFETNEGTATVREGAQPPSVSADALIYSGSHDVTVHLGTPAARAGTGGS